MQPIYKFLTLIAESLYPFRWAFVVAVFSPLIVSALVTSPFIVSLTTILMAWSFVFIGIILSYGPIKHFEGSVVMEGWRPFAPIFLVLPFLGALTATVMIPYVLYIKWASS